MSIGSGSKLVRFTDGQGVVNADLNNIGYAAQCAAWEWPGFMGLNAFADVYGISGDYPTTSGTYADKVFTMGGGGAVFFSGIQSYIHPGFLGIWSGAESASPSALATSMRWIQLSAASTMLIEHAATSSGQYRWDLVCLTVADAASDTATRAFKDSTTGAYTAQSISQSTLTSVTPIVRQGAEGATAATSLFGAAQAGDRLLALVLVHDSAVIAVKDLTIPFGKSMRARMMPTEAYFQSSAAADPVSLFVGNTVYMVVFDSAAYFLPPPSFRDPNALLIGVTVGGTIPSNCICEVGKFIPSDNPSTWVAAATVAHSGGDGTYSTFNNVNMEGRIPVWGNGITERYPAAPDTGFLALKIQGVSGTPVTVKTVTWQFKR